MYLLGIIRTHRSCIWLICAGIILMALVNVWVNRSPALHPLYAESSAETPDDKLQVKGYPIKHLPSTAKLMNYVGTFDMDGEGNDLFPTMTGFLTKSGNDFILHDWNDGHNRWKVTINTEKGWGQPRGAWSACDNPSFAISDDGRYFTASTVEKRGVRIRRWHDGKANGNILVLQSAGKSRKQGYYQLAISTTGRIFLQYSYDNGSRDINESERKLPPQYLLACDGRHIIASDTIPGQANILPGGAFVHDTASNILHSIRVTRGTIHFTRLARLGAHFVQCPGNHLVMENGAVYTPSGRKHEGTPQHQLGDHDVWRMAGLGYLSTIWASNWLVSSRGNQHKVFSVPRQSHWSFTSSPGMQDGAASADGRYLLLHGKGGIIDTAPARNLRSQETDAIWIYERPGILRAALRYNPEKLVSFGGHPGDTRLVGQTCNNWILSPDGRSVILKYQYMGVEGFALLYRW